MDDQNVQYPNRYKDKITGQVFDLEWMPGQVTKTGSAYNKANVLPENVCIKLGLNHTTAEPKDAFASVASGRYYGKMSQLTEGSSAGGSERDRVSHFCEFTTSTIDDYANLAKDAGKNYYTKIPIPVGAKSIKITATCSGGKTAWGDADANLYLGDVDLGVICTLASGGYDNTDTGVKVVDVTGNGNEYIKLWLDGSNDKQSGADSNRGIIRCSSLQLEVIK